LLFTTLKTHMNKRIAIEEDEEISILQSERDGRNKIGESQLHEIARSDDYQALKNLIQEGFDVNQKDNGGWTPLSEAVSHQKLSNVRLLLMKGAKVNVKSSECLMDDDGEKMTSSGLTPLMEACLNANVDIIKLLLHYKADILMRDDDDWTAIDHLREFIYNSNDLDAKFSEKLNELVYRMDEQYRKSGMEPRTAHEFYELLQLKRIRQKKPLISKRPEPTTTARKDTNPFGSDDENVEIGRRKRPAIASISSDSDSEYEETRNLNQYKDAIDGLRRNHKKKPSSSTKPAAVPSRRKSLQLAKKMFIN